MTAEELMMPRYKAIADFPGMEYISVGDIFHKNVIESGALIFRADAFPHLFKKLEWWEERQVEDMPNYLKQYSPDGSMTVNKIIRWDMQYLIGFIDDRFVCDINLWKNNCPYLPAPEQEYNDYLQSKLKP